MSAYKSNSSQDRPARNNKHYISRPKFCQFCSDPKIVIDYKNVELMSRFINETGKIRPRRQTGTCAKHQREVAAAVKNARHIALIPFEGDLWTDNN